ncbi:terpenoid cyclases/Protein prenyltransferase [Penicillium verhagenii]|uniref:terpenoid cyclases/Protein prenyltransferase n=1 Tax=Penicillium verhagenii TaxID=1562060 RepID=UPI002544F864|nr:terpenoid cyclases/Protein prenyltransferase [Penicillium verhagenii]KAJ5921344.1 terpenoid cyclases/Protein prenyltransferase [Penicillium verhagenii]
MSLESCSSSEDLLLFCGDLGRDGVQALSQFGSFTPSIYDSAWMSMVYKGQDSEQEWMFPQCLQYVLSLQQPDGAWPGFCSPVDGILSTGASLLALLNRRERTSMKDEQSDISQRIERAIDSLHNILRDWDVAKSDQVGFEVIVPSILRLIAQYDVHFTFPGQETLSIMHAKKMQKFHPQILYSDLQTTMLHSLEAFVGVVDFDMLKHHCTVENGVMASPAATSAYLMQIKEWDSCAEDYLNRVVRFAGDCSGGVPAAFPTCNFELSWTLSTLFLHVGLPNEDQISHLHPLQVILKTITAQQNGLIGWAPGIMPDPDDTARVLMTINFLGSQVDFTPMVTKFRSHPCFKTYEMERNPSLSANCNVLLALVSSDNPGAYVEEITAVLNYLLGAWKKGNLSDKWNSSAHYSCMILCSALVRALQLHTDSTLKATYSISMTQGIVLCLVQMVSQTLSEQAQDGSWGSSLEVTSYCTLTLAQMMRLPFKNDFKDNQLQSALIKGQDYILAHWHDSMKPDNYDYLWIEKVSYSSRLLRKVYAISALNANIDSLHFNSDILQYFAVPDGFSRMKRLLQPISMFKKSPMVSWHLILLEAALWSRYLQESKHDIFPPIEDQRGKDKHISLIPVIFTACNHMGNHVLSPNTIWEMIFISLLVYQTDELMESSVKHLSRPALEGLRQHIVYECNFTENSRGGIFASSPKQTPSSHDSYPSPASSAESVKLPPALTETDAPSLPHLSMIEIIRRLRSFINWTLGHPKVVESSQLMQRELASEMCSFLSGHIAHLASNAELSLTHRTTNPDYHRWVSSIGADDTSCPMASLFFVCLTSDSTKTAFEKSPLERYLSRSVFRHLAIMCRQYNDYGSVTRDMDEENLNSLHFPEFLSFNSAEKTLGISGHERVIYPSILMKEQLLAIAEFERDQMELAFKRLEEASVENCVLESVRVFINVTDLFGLVYIHRDYTNRVEHHRY